MNPTVGTNENFKDTFGDGTDNSGSLVGSETEEKQMEELYGDRTRKTLDFTDEDLEFQFQVGANEKQTIDVTLPTLDRIDIRSLDFRFGEDHASSEEVLEKLDQAIAIVSENRTEVGVNINRLKKGIKFASEQRTQQKATNSRIRDADLA